MGLACNQARLNVLTLRKSDLELQLTLLSMDNADLARKQSEAMSKKTEAMQNFFATNDTNVNFFNTQDFAEYEASMDEISAAEAKLDQKKALLETEHTAVVAEEEEIKNLIDENIEDSFDYFD